MKRVLSILIVSFLFLSMLVGCDIFTFPDNIGQSTTKDQQTTVCTHNWVAAQVHYVCAECKRTHFCDKPEYWERVGSLNESTTIYRCKICASKHYTLLAYDTYFTVSEMSSVLPDIINLSKTDNTCRYIFSRYTEIIGTYELTEAALTLTLETGDLLVFNVVNNKLVFDAKKSSMPVPVVEDGTVFEKDMWGE